MRLTVPLSIVYISLEQLLEGQESPPLRYPTIQDTHIYIETVSLQERVLATYGNIRHKGISNRSNVLWQRTVSSVSPQLFCGSKVMKRGSVNHGNII